MSQELLLQTDNKTYRIKDVKLSMGVCEDILNIVDVEKILDENASVTDMLGLIKHYKDIVMLVFPDMTDDEYRQLSPNDVSQFCILTIQYVIKELLKIGSKNPQRV